MIHRLLAVLLLTILSSVALAQSKAYAPEDLNRLSRGDQVRVLEREYEDQSGGARLPDDQLEFYLDQIESGWRFSRIKQDISESLGGGGGGWQPAPGVPVSRPFHCASKRKYGYGECRTPFDGQARLVRQTSRSACIEGRTWGSRYGVVWVNNGCEGEFALVGGGPIGGGYSVTCKSRDYGFSSCGWRQQYGYPQVLEQISQAPCVEGRSWGYDRTRGLWVNRGCEARFGTRY